MRKRLGNNKGIAIITAILALAFLTYLATEVTYDATVEYAVNSQQLKRLKAYYAARAGVEVSLLRIKAYQKVTQNLGKDAQNFPMINMIWQFPLQWPLVLPDANPNMSLTDKAALEESKEGSFFDATFDTQISDEGSKIDLNDLVSPSKVLRENARRQLLNAFQQEVENNQRFEALYRNYRFEELINQIADFMSSQRASLNGGDKAAAYNDTDYRGYPPNRAFRTLSELRVIPMMEEELFKIIESRATVFGLKGINPNTATKDVLMSLDISITAEIADRLIKRRENDAEGGLFKSPDDFWSAVESFGGRISTDKAQIPIVTDSLTSFRIKSTGIYSNVRSQIEVIVVDFDQVATRLADFVKKENQQASPPPGPGGQPLPAPAPAPAPAQAQSKQGPPRIVYWVEY